MPFSKDFLNSQRETYFLLKPDAPKTNAFHVKDVVNIEPFCLTQCPQNGCLYERCSQCEASAFKAKCPPKWMPFSNDFLILSVKPIFC